MIDVANLVLEVDSRDVEQGRQALTRLARTGTEASNELATALKRSENEFKDLKRSIDPAYRASIQYKEAVETVRRAVRTGAITQDEANRALQQVATQYRVTSAAAEQYGMAVSRAGGSSSRFGFAIQNASFQVADFAVMVGSGMGVTRAFATQLPQLLGPLGMWGALLGAVVAIGGALVPVLFDMNKKTKEFTELLEDAQAAVDRAGRSMENIGAQGADRLRERYGQLTERVRELSEALADIERQAMTVEVQEAMSGLFSPEFFDQVTSKLGAVGAAMVETTDEDIAYMRREIGLLEQQIENFPHLEPTLRNQLTEMREELAAMIGDTANMGSLLDGMIIPPDAIQQFRDLEQTIRNATAAGNFQEAADGISDMRSLMESFGIEVNEGAVANMTRLEDVLRQAIARGLELDGATDGTAANVSAAANEASRLADELMRAASNAMSLAQQSAFGVIESEIRLRTAGDPVAQARELAGARFDYQVGDVTGMDPVVQQGLAQQREAYIANAEAIARNQQALADWNAAQRSGGGAAREFNRELERARDLYTELSSGHERFQEELDLLRQQFDNGTISLDTYIERLGELKDAMTANERTAKNLENAFANTATSIVMGSESASSAVSRLLNQLAQMALNAAFQSLFGGMFGGLSWLFTPSAMGNVFAQGNVVPFAKGGVVSGPTVFPMAGRSTGLMGEAGPEAVMPLSRGPDGKLGVAAGGEQTIRLVVEAEEGELFVPRVRQISGQTAVQVSRNTARAQQRAFPATLDEYDRRGTT